MSDVRARGKEGSMTRSGGCLCGEVRFEAEGAPLWVGHCHCVMCRRQSGAAFLTGLIYRAAAVTWSAARPQVYESSPGIERGFCPTCGGTLSFARRDKAEMCVFAGSLDDPDAIEPSAHIFAEQRCAWLRLDDGLPSHARFPPGGEDREV
jgi:hypothetical protein